MAGALYCEKCIGLSSSNDTVYIDPGDYELTIYNKTDLSHYAFKEGAPFSALRTLSPTIVRIEIKLVGTGFLRKLVASFKQRGGNKLTQKGRYKQWFNELGRGPLRLD